MTDLVTRIGAIIGLLTGVFTLWDRLSALGRLRMCTSRAPRGIGIATCA